jgi:tetratricopeptide (TPR) repeat protein
MPIRPLIFSAVFALLVLASCETKQDPLTAAEATQFGRRLERSLALRRTGPFDSVLSETVFGERIAEALGEKNNTQFIRGVIVGLRRKRLGKEILDNIGKDGTYSLLRQYEKDGHHHLLFRLMGENGFNYHDLELVKTGNKVKAADLFVYLSGENLSETMAGTFSAMSTTAGKNDNELTLQSARITSMRNLVEQGRYADAAAAYKSFPRMLQNVRAMQVMNLNVLSQLNGDEFEDALKRFELSYGTEGAAQLMLLNGNLVIGNFDKALRSLNILDTAVKGDPMLNYYRGLIYFQRGDDANAFASLEKLQHDLPDYSDGSVLLMARYLQTHQEEKAAKILTAYRANRRVNQQKLNAIQTMYPSFAKKYGLKSPSVPEVQ